MNITHEAILAYSDRVEALNPGARRGYLALLEKKREATLEHPDALASLQDEEWDAWINESARQSSSWHWIWCIAACASVTEIHEILPEHWVEAVNLLAAVETPGTG